MNTDGHGCQCAAGVGQKKLIKVGVVKTTMAVVGGQTKGAAGFRAFLGMQQHHAITARAGIGFASAVGVNLSDWQRERCLGSVHTKLSKPQSP